LIDARAHCDTSRVDEPTLTYVYMYAVSALVLAFGLYMARRAGTLNARWATIMIVGFLAYALGHAFFQFVAPNT
jgi:cytosine/uracil/thiamine/allantoin permease